ncbi:MAG: hypothetical protein JXA89_12660 [Anaerolineae bacterium]|nr:hypothetical protein [Anaerolineae bacterium]
MHTKKYSLFLSLLVIAFVVQGCGSSQPTRAPVLPSPAKTAAPTVTPYLIPTAPPLPSVTGFTAHGIDLDGWQGIEITHLCLEYSLEGISPIPESLNMETFLLSRLEAYGTQVITKTSDSCDGVLTIDATVRPISASYTPGGTCYSGASVDIEIALAAQGHQASFQIRNEKSPPPNITSCAKNPEEAPFADLWRCEFMGVLGQIWGPPLYFANLQIPGLYSDTIERIKCTAPTDETIELVLSKLGDPIGDPANYHTALELISHWRLSEAAPYLHATIHTPDLPSGTVIATANALYFLGELGEQDLPPIIALVKASNGENPDLTALFRGVTPPKAAISALLDALEGANSTTRETIADSLAGLGEPAYDYVIPMLEDRSQAVCDKIVNHLRYQDYTVIAPLLSYAAQTEYLPARQAIARILAQVSGHEFGEDLDAWQSWWQEMEGQMSSLQPDDFATALASDEVILRQYTLEQIVQLGPAAADMLPILTEMLNSDGGGLSFLTARALGALGPEGVDALSNQISDNTTRASISADWSIYGALGVIGPDAIDSVPVLITNLSQMNICETLDSGPMFTIVRALNTITGQNFGCDVDAWQTWWNENYPSK